MERRATEMRRGRSGQILILVLGVMGLGMFVLAPLLAYVDVSLRMSMRYELKTEAYLAAEAGIERVIGDLYMGTDILVGDAFLVMVIRAAPVYGAFDFELTSS